MRPGILRLLVLFALLACVAPLQARTLAGDETWSGTVQLAETTVVPAGARLTILPGTLLRFADRGTLVVEGALTAQGERRKPIVFKPAPGLKPGSWQGLVFREAQGESLLQAVRIEGAVCALEITGSTVRLNDVTLRQGTKGLVLTGGTLQAQAVTILDMSEAGFVASKGAQGEFTSGKIERVKEIAIQCVDQANVNLRNNTIRQAEFGFFVSGDVPPLEGNTIEGCKFGIGLSHTGPETILRRNTVKNCDAGVACRQFASPTIEYNTLTNCKEGIQCIQMSSPVILRNRIERARRGLACVQMCNPLVTRNDFLDNDTAAYLHLSSYARFHDNNFERNRLHIELDNMSYDWEVRAERKPKRSLEAQSEGRLRRGQSANSTQQGEGSTVESEGFVNAKGNYWGKETTRDMNRNGAQANIKAIHDGFDIPTRTYDGWPGEYLQDRVNYDGWQQSRIVESGL